MTAANLFAAWNTQDRTDPQPWWAYVTEGEFADALEDFPTGTDEEITTMVERRAAEAWAEEQRETD